MISAAQPALAPNPNPGPVEMPGVAAEIRLLILASRLVLPSSDAMQALLRLPLDWTRVLQLAQLHGVTPLLCRALETFPGLVPPEILTALRARYLRTAKANLLRVAELLRVLDLLGNQGVACIPYKGPVAGAAIYGDLALREFSDLDLLVQPAALQRAGEVLLRSGYRSEFDLTARQQARYLRSACELNFVHRELGVMLELHWQVLPRQFSLQFDLDGMWARSTRLPLGSAAPPALSPADTLLVLSAHSAKHLWERLIWTADIAGLLGASPALDWEFVFSEAERIGALRILSISLRMVELLQLAELPGYVRPRVAAGRRAARLALSVADRLLHPSSARSSRVSTHLNLLLARERWRDRAKYALRTTLGSISSRYRPSHTG